MLVFGPHPMSIVESIFHNHIKFQECLFQGFLVDPYLHYHVFRKKNTISFTKDKIWRK